VKLAWRLLLAAAVAAAVLALAVPRGDGVAQRVWTAVLAVAAPALAAPQWQIEDGRVALAAGIGQPILVGHQLVEPDPRHRLTAQVPLGSSLLLPVVLLTAALAAGAAPLRWVAGALAAAALLALETPLLLSAAVHAELLHLLSPESSAFGIAAAQWWNHGGRLVVAAGAVLVLLGPRLS
jgi:hypothetical protein